MLNADPTTHLSADDSQSSAAVPKPQPRLRCADRQIMLPAMPLEDLLAPEHLCYLHTGLLYSHCALGGCLGLRARGLCASARPFLDRNALLAPLALRHRYRDLQHPVLEGGPHVLGVNTLRQRDTA
jgi:hypothetical protein